jgi:hypothetical protein
MAIFILGNKHWHQQGPQVMLYCLMMLEFINRLCSWSREQLQQLYATMTEVALTSKDRFKATKVDANAAKARRVHLKQQTSLTTFVEHAK